ncbi:hypothetical protein GCM10011581_26040 [Saccharopolyspora subtropica]|uniref:FAD-dependent monooxygenase n=1 Tax=Saccharopolyspora thermophila TaxID=89367 RepID=A0A917JVC3_9PSEU|nr:hypothetical protein GCM10011581_26040 [Saccharopolyspora subtropica]
MLGGGLAGMLAARVLARHLDSVVVVERDRYPDGPVVRKGVPQAHHGHLLLTGGAQRLDRLLPGVVDELVGQGARRLGLPSDVVSLTAQGWMPRFRQIRYALCCSRALLEWTVRKRVLGDGRIQVVEGTEAVRLCGTADRVTGALVRDRSNGQLAALDADLVVDATGRGSKATVWLRALGLPEVREELVDPGLAYATRLYRAPTADFPTVSVQADPGGGRPGRAAVIFPIEGAQWLVTLSGTRGAEPPVDDAGFEEFARNLPHGVIGELIAAAEPLGRARGYRNNANRRHRFDLLAQWPDGFAVLGDAVATTNPTYAHGMSVAAAEAVALDRELSQHRLRPGSFRRVQRRIVRATHVSWVMATSQDRLYPGVVGGGPTRAALLQKRLADRLQRVAGRDPVVFGALLGAHTLSGAPPLSQIPRVVAGLLRGAGPLDSGDPPFTAAERAVLTNRGEQV